MARKPAKKRARPSGWAQRLAKVCELVGARNVKEFHASLDGENLPEFPSYAAAQTYHGPPWRSPPAAYLARIIERYPTINPVWLFTGRGPHTVAEAQAAASNADFRRLADLFEDALVGWVDEDYSAPEIAQWDTWIAIRNSLAYPQAIVRDDEVATAKRIIAAVRAPLEHLGLEPGQLRSREKCDAYVRLMCEAIMQAWLAATTETKPLGWFQASLQRETDAAREKGADETLDELLRRADQAIQAKDAVDTSSPRKEEGNDGE